MAAHGDLAVYPHFVRRTDRGAIIVFTANDFVQGTEYLALGSHFPTHCPRLMAIDSTATASPTTSEMSSRPSSANNVTSTSPGKMPPTLHLAKAGRYYHGHHAVTPLYHPLVVHRTYRYGKRAETRIQVRGYEKAEWCWVHSCFPTKIPDCGHSSTALLFEIVVDQVYEVMSLMLRKRTRSRTGGLFEIQPRITKPPVHQPELSSVQFHAATEAFSDVKCFIVDPPVNPRLMPFSVDLPTA